MSGYDAWLERPYRVAEAEAQAFEDAAEAYGLDPEKDAEEIQRRMDEEDEAAAEKLAEDMADARAHDDPGKDVW